MASIHLPIRQLVEFLLRTGSIDSRFTGFDRANEGARIHRRLQKAAGEGYAAEVYLTAQREVEGLLFVLEGRADGIFQNEDGTVVIDEIKMDEIKTKKFAGFLSAVNADCKALVVTAEANENVVLSARNLPGVQTTFANLVNVYDILNAKKLVLDKAALAKIEEVFA
mgnify:CR=1 FL=1